MGKRITSQRRGSGSPSYRSPSHRYKLDLLYRSYDDAEKAGVLRGQVIAFLDDPVRDALVMQVRYETGETSYVLAPEGIAVGDTIDAGAQARLTAGSVMPLYRIPDGAYIFNIERTPGDGGKFVRAAGSYATVVSKEKGVVYVKLPSRAVVRLSNECRAQLGIIAGGGRLEKPLLKAGTSFYKFNARNRLWPIVRGVHMSAYNHPHGGKQHHIGKSSVVARSAPPGSKVGHIAARSTGRKKTRKAAEGESK